MKDKLKVIYLVNIPSPYRVSFFNELGKLCDLTVLFERRTSEEREEAWHDYRFDNFNGVFLDGIQFRKNQALSFGFLKYFDSKKYDCIVIGGYSTPTGILAINYLRLKRIPFVLNIDGGMIRKNEKKIIKHYKKFHISSASAWLSTGKVGSEYLEYYGANKDRIYVYPFTTLMNDDLLDKTISSVQKKELQEEYEITGSKVAISVGRFIQSKGFDVLIKAWASVASDYSLHIIGGEPNEEYIKLKKKLGLKNIFFHGHKEKEKLYDFYKAADLFILPTRSDVWGLVVNEAMANGLPIITTNKCVAGLELVENYENGFLVPVENTKSLSEKIKETLNDEELLNKMSENNLLKIQKYTIENMANETFKILHKLREG